MRRTTRVLQTSSRGSVRRVPAGGWPWALGLALAACGACAQQPALVASGEAPSAMDSTQAPASAGEMKQGNDGPTQGKPPAGAGEETGLKNDVPADLIGTAISDAVRRTGAARSDVKVMVAESVTWADGSMGCPQEGMMYTQALVPGYRIVLQAAGQTLNYHASGKGGPTFCPAERVVPPSQAGGGRDSV